MADAREINYPELIDRVLGDFRPVKRLWPPCARLALWILLCAMIAGIGTVAGGTEELRRLRWSAVLAFAPVLLATGAAAYLALRSAIPDRAANLVELVLPGFVMAVAPVAARFAAVTFSESLGAPQNSGWIVIAGMTGLAAGPSLALFWAVRRGYPVRAPTAAGLIGVAGWGFALSCWQLLSGWTSPPAWQANTAGAVIITLALRIGAGALNPARQSRRHDEAPTAASRWGLIDLRAIVPVALAVAVAIAIFIPRGTQLTYTPIPDFDLAIASYQRSLTGFRSNVPSSSVEAVVTAYVEHGMPAYMWDFGPDGFRLVGGRFDRLPDGTPLTYTWFRGPRGGVLCMFKRTDAFIPPAASHEEKRHLLFYRYRGFSVCLINVGGYGSFISVIVSPEPMREFMALVVKAAS